MVMRLPYLDAAYARGEAGSLGKVAKEIEG
jgi:hypothetical protein